MNTETPKIQWSEWKNHPDDVFLFHRFFASTPFGKVEVRKEFHDKSWTIVQMPTANSFPTAIAAMLGAESEMRRRAEELLILLMEEEPSTPLPPEPCGDCDPCCGGRPDQCAISPSP